VKAIYFTILFSLHMEKQRIVGQLTLSIVKPRLEYGSYRITECSGLEGTSVGHLVQPPCLSSITCFRASGLVTVKIPFIHTGNTLL